MRSVGERLLEGERSRRGRDVLLFPAPIPFIGGILSG